MKSVSTEWSRCRPWIEAAIPYCYGTHTIEDVERLIGEERLQFWPGERCAVVTEVIEYPRLKALAMFAGGGDLDELMNKMFPAMVEWARSIGCTRIIGGGRKGWLRVLRKLGYEHSYHIVLKEI